MIRIVVDSTCDLPAELYHEHHISVVPINIQFGTDSYRDGVDIDLGTFYRLIDERGVLPQTSQPSAGQFQEQYLHLADEGVTDIISIHVTDRLSGTLQSAQMAGEMVEERVRVHPFDSATGSAGLGFLALEAARLAEAGRSVGEILARLEGLRPRIYVLLTMKDLRFAQMSGRVGRLQSSLASLLDIKPIVILEDGLIEVGERVRSRGRAVQRMLALLKERLGPGGPVNLAAIHANDVEVGEAVLAKARDMFDCRLSFVADLTASLVVHFGPGTLGLVAYRP